MLLSLVLPVILCFVGVGFWKCISAVLSIIKVSLALRNIPTPPKQHWFFGHAPYCVDRNNNAIGELDQVVMPFINQGHYKLFRTSIGPGLPCVHLCHPETIRNAIGSDPKFESHYLALRPWLGDGLLTSNGAKWSRHRRLLTNAFHYDILKSYVDVFSDCASVFINQVDKAVSSDMSVVDIVPLIRLFTLDTLLRCICGQETNCQIIGTRMPYVESVFALSTLSINRMLSFARFDLIYAFLPMKRIFSKHCRVVHMFSQGIIETRRKELIQNKTKSEIKKYLDFIDVLLAAKDENGQGLTNFEIREQVDTFVFEGHDTTAASLGWIIYLLAKHPEHQAKCREEVDALFDKKDTIEWDDLKELPYLHYCIKEANRLYPPVPVITRGLTTSRTIEGYQLPKGIPVALQIYGCHHNPHVWKEPEIFDPLRFTPENSENRDPLAYIPFSAGPRNCIGQNFALAEEKVVLSMFLRTFQLSLDEGHTTKQLRHLILHPDSVYLKLQRR